jgi:hypothetical protein
MTHFARVKDDKVTDVIVADQEFVDGITEMEAAHWVQSSSASKGGNYDPQAQVFYPAQPYSSWTLDKSSWTWVAPKEEPDNGKDYVWYESLENWSEPDDYIET